MSKISEVSRLPWKYGIRVNTTSEYTLECAVLENVDNIKYLGVTITNDLKWNTHISNICTKFIFIYRIHINVYNFCNYDF